MEKRQATNISPKNQNWFSCSKPRQGMVYSSKYKQNALYPQQFSGRTCSLLSTQSGCNNLYFSLPFISSPNSLQMNTWALCLTPPISASFSSNHHDYRNHVSGSLSTYVSTLKWGKILCCNLSREDKNVQNLSLSGKHDWTE